VEADLPLIPAELGDYKAQSEPKLEEDTERIYPQCQCMALRFKDEKTNRQMAALFMVSCVLSNFHQPERCSNAQGWWTKERQTEEYKVKCDEGVVLPGSYFISEDNETKTTLLTYFWYVKEGKLVRGLGDVDLLWMVESRLKRGKVPAMTFIRLSTIMPPGEEPAKALERIHEFIEMLHPHTLKPRGQAAQPFIPPAPAPATADKPGDGTDKKGAGKNGE